MSLRKLPEVPEKLIESRVPNNVDGWYLKSIEKADEFPGRILVYEKEINGRIAYLKTPITDFFLLESRPELVLSYLRDDAKSVEFGLRYGHLPPKEKAIVWRDLSALSLEERVTRANALVAPLLDKLDKAISRPVGGEAQ